MSLNTILPNKTEIFGKKYNVFSIGKTLVFDPEIYTGRNRKPINIKVQQSLIDKLSYFVGGEGMPAKSRWQFGDVINAFWLLNKRKMSNPEIVEALHLDEKTVSNYMGLAKQLKKDEGEQAAEILRVMAYDKDYEEFLKDPLVIIYRGELDSRPKTEKHKTELDLSPPKVYKALLWLNLNPNAFLFEGVNMNSAEKLRKIKENLKPYRDHILLKSQEKVKNKGKTFQNTSWYSHAKALRSFITLAGGINVPRQPPDSVLAQSVKEFAGKYKHVRAEPHHITKLKEYLKPNKPAYFMFLLSLEIGFRANEAFTISTKTFGDDRQSGIKEMTFQGKTRYQIQIMTRKSFWIKQYTHKVLILDDETNELISERLKEIEIAEKEYPANHLLDHSLIGHDNQFVQVNTLQEQKPEVTHQQQLNQNALMDFFRKCYVKAGLGHPYYTQRPFHSMRHIFAQYWLNKTSYDYQFVADLGHWKTLSVLKDSYGGMSEHLFFQKQSIYHDREHTSIEQEANEKISKDELNIISETYKTDLHFLRTLEVNDE